MKKSVLMKVFLILLPAMAVLLATTGDSVSVVDTLTGTTETYSYFDLIPDLSTQMCMPLAALLAVAATVLAALHVATAKPWCVRGLYWVAFLSATVAVIPILARGEILVIPNVGLPILMLIDCLLAGILKKKPEGKKVEETEPRLKRK